MKIKLHYLFLLIVSQGLISCASYKGFPDRVIEPEEELNNLKTYFSTDAVDKYNNAVRDEERKRIRNEIINGRIAAIDLQFSLFQKKLREDGLNINVTSDAIILGLGAAGALVSGGTSQILSATSAAVAGLRESIDKNAFYEQTMPALFAQMIAQRKKVLVKIRRGLANSSIDYPLQQGFADLEDYQYAGSIPGSIATIVEDAGATSAKATRDLNVLSYSFNQDIGALKLEDYLGSPELTEEYKRKALKVKSCWPEIGVPENTLWVDFKNMPEYADQRVKSVDCAKK